MVKPLRLVLLAWALAPGAARAHVETNPTLVNRYASFLVGGNAREGYKLEAIATLMYGPVPGAAERKRMDRDGDGVVSTAEREEAQRGWIARAREVFAMSVDGAPLALDGCLVQLGDGDRLGPGLVMVEIFGSREVSAGTRRLRVEPGADLPHLGETEIGIDLAHEWSLVAGGRGASPEHAERSVKMQGPRASVVEDRSVTFVIRAHGASGGRSTRPLLLASAAAILGAAVIATLALQRRRRERGATGAETGTGS